MSVIRSKEELQEKLSLASAVSPDHHVVLTRFIENAAELDVNAVRVSGKLLIHAVSEHVEVSQPPYNLRL
jgi:carbamoyl-phosphate synthase large subunit